MRKGAMLKEAMLKDTRIRERLKVRFGAETVNAFSHRSAFGAVSGESALTRICQFGIKAIF